MPRLLTVGIVGTVVSALCCFTPILVIVLGAQGLSSVLGILDFVLIPALVVFIIISVVAIIRRHKKPSLRTRDP